MAQTEASDNGNATVPQVKPTPRYSIVGQPEKVTMCAAVIHELREFGSTTTAHAIPRALQAERAPIRFLWTIIFVLASITFLIHLGFLLNHYVKYPISTTVSYKTAEFIFPDVTICNLLPFSLRKLELKDPGLSRASEIDERVLHYKEVLDELLEGTQHDEFSMILKCEFNQEYCGPHNFTTIVDPTFGFCFTFSPASKIMANSPEYGLNLMIYAENKHGHTLPDFRFTPDENWEASGVRLVIHERGTHPHPDIKGVNVQTGVDARFAVSMEKLQLYYIFRKGEWRCDNDDRKVEYCARNLMIKSRQYKEITEDCLTKTIQELTMARCNCLSPDHEVPSDFCETRPLNFSSDLCDESNLCYAYLREDLKENFERLIVSACRPTCTQISYAKQMSTSDWPSHIAEKRIMKYIRDHYGNMTSQGLNTTLDELVASNDAHIEEYNLIKDNFLRITVYPEALTGNEVQEDLAYPLANFVSEVGGILGLWLGGSMLTFLEPLELVANLILICRMIKRGGGRIRREPQIDLESGVLNGPDGEAFRPVRSNYSITVRPDPFCPPPPMKNSVSDPFCKQ